MNWIQLTPCPSLHQTDLLLNWLFFFYFPAVWHQFHFPLFLVNCCYAFTSLMIMTRWSWASLSYVKWTDMGRPVWSAPRQVPACKSRCLVCSFTSGNLLAPQRCWGYSACLSPFTGWTDESLVLSQGDLPVCPVWGRPTAWLEEESRISTNSSCDQTGSRLLQQNWNRYWLMVQTMLSFLLFSLFIFICILVASKAVTVGLVAEGGLGGCGGAEITCDDVWFVHNGVIWHLFF